MCFIWRVSYSYYGYYSPRMFFSKAKNSVYCHLHMEKTWPGCQLRILVNRGIEGVYSFLIFWHRWFIAHLSSLYSYSTVHSSFTSLCFFFLFFLSFVVDIPLISFRRVLKTPTFPLSRPRVSRKAKSLVPGLYTALTLVQCTKFSQKNSTIFSALH